MPFIKPPAAETASHGSSQHGWSCHPRELHPRAEGRRLAKREVGLCMKRMPTGKPNIALARPGNTGGFAPRCPAWPGQHDTPGDGRDFTAESVEKAGTFQALVQLLSAAELQPALLMADAHQPAAQCGVSPPWWATEGLALVLLGTALLHSNLLLPDRNLGAPSHQAPSSHSFLGATGQCYGYPVDPLLLGPDVHLPPHRSGGCLGARLPPASPPFTSSHLQAVTTSSTADSAAEAKKHSCPAQLPSLQAENLLPESSGLQHYIHIHIHIHTHKIRF